MENSDIFKCISFPIGSKYRLKRYLDHLKEEVKRSNDWQVNSLKLVAILVAINYASKFSFDDFDYLRRQGGSLPNSRHGFNINFVNPMTHKLVKFRDVKLIKHINMFREKPLFELRVNKISNYDFGFRCIFFIPQDDKRWNYQCYVSPFTKSIRRRVGDKETNQNVAQTNVAYEQYCANPYNFNNVFTNVNYLINKDALKEG